MEENTNATQEVNVEKQEISKLSDECTENVLYLLKILTNLKEYSTEDLHRI